MVIVMVSCESELSEQFNKITNYLTLYLYLVGVVCNKWVNVKKERLSRISFVFIRLF